MTHVPNRPVPTEHDEQALEEAAERAAILSTRSHVGAAGFAQTQALEMIISAGREQIALTQALRQVVVTAQAQLRDIAVRFDAQIAQVHTGALEGIVESGRSQIAAADELRRAIQATLTDVRGTPVEDISVTVLTTLGTVVRRQAQGLKDLIEVAISEATSAEQITKLERVSAEAALRIESVEHERTERELAYLEHLKQQTLTRIRQLEADGLTHAAQRAQLERDAAGAQERIVALEAADLRDRAQIAQLERQEQGAAAHIAHLEDAAERHHTRLAVLSGESADHEGVPGELPDVREPS